MATFSQEAKRLVLVAATNDPYEKITGDIAAGELGFRAGNGAAVATALQTDNPTTAQIILKNSAGAEALHSEIITKEMVKEISFRAYEAPYEAVTLIRLGAGTYDAGEELVLGVHFQGFGSLSMKNPYHKYGAYYVPTDATTAATAAAALVLNLNKNLDKDQVARATASVGSAVSADVAAATATTTGYTIVKGARSMALTGGDTFSDATTSGWILITDSASVVHLLYATFTTGSATVTFDRPYTGASDTTRADSNLAALTTADIVIVGDRQAVINFDYMFNQTTFDVSLTVDGESDTNVSSTLKYGSFIGNGYGPHVANIEMFANESLNRDQFNGPNYRRYNAPMYTNTAVNYDVVKIKLATTKEAVGSNITSVREIEIFGNLHVTGDTVAKSMATFAADLAAWAGVTVK